MVGDNFYPGGLRDVNDPRFEEIFEMPFHGSHGVFHPVLGDNDYGDKYTMGSLSAQVLMSERNDNWVMPDLYYSRQFVKNGVSLCAVFIDTQSLIEITYYEDRSDEEISTLSAQLDWLRATISSESCRLSDFVIVFGHHAVKSGGKKARKGPAKLVAQTLLPLFEDFKIDAYFSGHDHDLQVIKKDVPLNSCDGLSVHCMVFVVSGAASRLRDRPEIIDIDGYMRWGVEDTFGFSVSRVSKDVLETSIVASKSGAILHMDSTPSHKAMRENLVLPRRD
jgi:hypothetical protein